MRLLLAIAATGAALVPLASSVASPVPPEHVAVRATQTPVEKSPDLWATINVCDTDAHPNTIGIRGSMPGLRRRAGMWMRFQVQYLAKSDDKWHNIDSNADSAWKKVGAMRKKVI